MFSRPARTAEERRWQLARTLRLLYTAIWAGTLGAIAYSGRFGWTSQTIEVAAFALLVCGASLLLGILLGFLFAIPRTLASHDKPGAAAGVGVGSPQGDPGKGSDATTNVPTASTGLETNTNLDQISDWLTKILVGVGLTQIGQFPARMQQLAAFLSPGLGNTSSSPAVGVIITVYFAITGFLLGYMWTRLVLSPEFVRASREIAGVGAVSADAVEQLGKATKERFAQQAAQTANLVRNTADLVESAVTDINQRMHALTQGGSQPTSTDQVTTTATQEAKDQPPATERQRPDVGQEEHQ